MPRIQNKIDFDGAVITVRIELCASEEAFFRATGQPVPPPVATTALFDIGASHTAIHPMILDHLGAFPIGEGSSSVPGQNESSRHFFV